MPRAAPVRSIAALLAICVALVTVLSAFSEPCPVHDPAFARLAAAGHHVGHSGAQAAGHDHLQKKAHGCTCVGCGCCASVLKLPATSLSFAPAAISTGSRAPLPVASVRGLARAEHSLPFSTAPPVFLALNS